MSKFKSGEKSALIGGPGTLNFIKKREKAGRQ